MGRGLAHSGRPANGSPAESARPGGAGCRKPGDQLLGVLASQHTLACLLLLSQDAILSACLQEVLALGGAGCGEQNDQLLGGLVPQGTPAALQSLQHLLQRVRKCLCSRLLVLKRLQLCCLVATRLSLVQCLQSRPASQAAAAEQSRVWLAQPAGPPAGHAQMPALLLVWHGLQDCCVGLPQAHACLMQSRQDARRIWVTYSCTWV